MRQLSAFQEETETALNQALRAVGSALVDRRLDGRDETYIRARARGLDAELFIYAGEAGVWGPGINRRFETPDYENSSALSAAFISTIVDLLRDSGGKSN